MAQDDFKATRTNVLYISVLGGLVTLIGLVCLEVFRSYLWGWLVAAGTNVLGVLFGLSVVSLVWEFAVRKAHSADLRHYLRLGASVAQSGLQEVTVRSKLDWQRLLDSAIEVTVLTHSADWLERNQYHLRDVARSRPLGVTVAVPVRNGAYLLRTAALQGVSPDRPADAISDTASRASRLWREAAASDSPLRPGARLSVVEHDLSLGYEVILIDKTLIVTLAAPGDVSEVQDRVAFVYSQSRTEYPSSFFVGYLPELVSMNRLEEVAV